MAEHIAAVSLRPHAGTLREVGMVDGQLLAEQHARLAELPVQVVDLGQQVAGHH